MGNDEYCDLGEIGRAPPVRSACAGSVRVRRAGVGRTRFTAVMLPFLAATASLGFEHAEAGILRAPPVTSDLARPSHGELGLRSSALRRTAAIRDYAGRYRIGWTLSERIHDAAMDAGIDVDLAFRLVRVESSFKQGAIGPAGSIGFTQVQPNTARWLDPSVTREDLFDVDTNLRLGFGYLRMLIDRYGSTPARIARVQPRARDDQRGPGGRGGSGQRIRRAGARGAPQVGPPSSPRRAVGSGRAGTQRRRWWITSRR